MWAPTHRRWQLAGLRHLRWPAGMFLASLSALAGISDFAHGSYIKIKAFTAQILLEQAWTRSIETQTAEKPWLWADFTPSLKISVPRLSSSDIVLSSVSGQAMAFGPGLMEGPRPGEPGLAILAAHRDTHFRFLKDIRIGDIVEVTTKDRQHYRFRIIQTSVVDAYASGLYTDGSEPEIALVTCWPFNATSRGALRFVARGILVKSV